MPASIRPVSGVQNILPKGAPCMRTCSGAQPDDRQPRLTSAKRSALGLGWRVADHAAVRAGGTARLRPERNPALPAKGPVRHHEEPALIGRGREALAFGLKGQDRSDHSSYHLRLISSGWLA